MILLQASHIAKQYEGHDVLFDASIVVQSGERVALVGANGAGKSTLLRILMGEEGADSGDLSVSKNVQVGYVAQFVASDKANTVYEFVAEAFQDIYDMERRLRTLERQMADETVYTDAKRFQEISEAYDSLHRQFDEQNGYAVETRIRRVLDGLQFPTPMHGQSVTSLSGGQKTRLALARLLASEPDVLVLDEPTNYLDTDTLTWLEAYLQGYAGALLVVSHDRYFLDQIASVVYELEDGRTTRYVGNYSDYVEQKASRLEGDMKRYEAQQKEIARMEEFVQKNIVRATTTKRAQSRRKMLERMVKMERPSAKTPKMALSFTTARTSGKDVLRVVGLVVGYPGKTLPGPLDFTVHREQRIAILGPNGMGKTSFLKALIGKLKPLDGTIRFGTNVDIGYYDQEQTHLNDNKTVLAEVWDRYPTLDKTSVRTALGRFLFRGEDVEKPVGSLSGGERSRLSLCLLMLQESNVLIMDEPTNHLDLLAKEVLEDALQDYDGTLIFVSHDRYFIDALATHVVVLNENGFRTYIGNYTDYVRKRDDEEKWSDENQAAGTDSAGPQSTRRTGAVASPGSGSKASSGPAVPGSPAASARGGTYREATSLADAATPLTDAASTRRGAKNGHVRSADLRKLREAVQKVENHISELEERIEAIGVEMTEAAINQEVERTRLLQVELDDKSAAHEVALEQWETLAAELEALEGES